ncbi:MAG TPA: ThuA domain-containing protein, partial [Candidatus Hydrogenedentes bacterium]|nr:ThuA domain-containing protein [Candidatus Hydrogenedentota bacterium]
MRVKCARTGIACLVGIVLMANAAYSDSEEQGKASMTNGEKHILIVTGQDYPGHVWRETAPVLAQAIAADLRLRVEVTEDPAALASSELDRFDAIVLHFMNWEQPDPGEEARANLKRFVESGKGLCLVHFACGAFQEWPEFGSLAGRVWDPQLRAHDPFGAFRVEIVNKEHPVTAGLESFETTDELYTCLAGDRPIELLATARSVVDGKDYPMAFAFTYGAGRVFHSPLGHDAQALANPPVAELFRRGCAWAAGLPPAPPKKIVMIAGADSHEEGAHRHEQGLALLKQCLDTASNVSGIETVLVREWPEDASLLDNAAAIVVYADGFEGHPLVATPERLARTRELMDRGVGLVCLHFAVAPPRDEASERLFGSWLGGFYKDGYSQNPIHEVEVTPASPEYPISRGLVPYVTREEFYYRVMFPEGEESVTSSVTAMLPPDAPRRETLAWAVVRENGGRGFGFTGGHYHATWRVEP